MHRSRLCAVLIDGKTSNVDEAARFWSEALGRPVDKAHPSSRAIIACWRPHPTSLLWRSSRWTTRVGSIYIETDDIPAEVARLEKLGAKVVNRLERWVVMQALTGQRFCVVRVQRPGFPKNANSWD